MVHFTALFLGLLCFTYVRAEAEVEDLNPLVKTTEEALQGAKTHVEHMLNLDPIPNHEKLPPLVKNETEHLAYEIKKLATKLQEKIGGEGEHKPEIKEAVTQAVTHLTEAAASLEHVGADLKEDNVKYYAAADKVLQEAKHIVAAGPCQALAPVLKDALHELTHDVNNYQYGIHELIGPHEGGKSASEAGHKPHDDHHHHHHVHHHQGASSEESSEEKSSSSHSHNHDHHHH